MPATRSRRPIFVALAALVAAGAAYAVFHRKDDAAQSASAVIPVKVRTLKAERVRAFSDFSARLRAVDSADIRPEVTGRIVALKFEDGQQVKAGQVLFVIDPRPFEAAETKAKADLSSALANARFAAIEEDRAAGMVKSKAIAQRLYDERQNALKVAEAAKDVAKAEIQRAMIDVDHAYVKSPITGRAGRAEVTLGNLVEAGPNAPLLTSVVDNRYLYADFEVDEQTYLASVRRAARERDQERTLPVKLVVKGDKDHVYEGRIYSFDNQIDRVSGTIRARAKFKNDDGALVPGMFATASLANATEAETLLVPVRALGFDQDRKYVYVVGEGDKVAYRGVELGRQIGENRIVLGGLKPGERIVVEGTQHVRPDAVVAPTEEGAPAPTLAPAAGK